MPWVAGAIAGSAVIGAGASLYGSSQAAGAAKDAAALQEQQFQQTQGNLQPYNTVGQSAAQQLQALNTKGFTAGQPDYVSTAAGMQPGAMTEANLINTPGYQFNLTQGLQSTQNAAAARGLGVSGASLKGAASYATGLADSTYQNQFNNQQTLFQNELNLNTAQQGNAMNQYNRLAGTASLGENAAASAGAQGTLAAANAGNYLNQAGGANAAGTLGAANALTGGANNALAYNYLNGLTGSGQTGGYGSTQTAYGLYGSPIGPTQSGPPM
jgi:hypothetical protein